MSGNKLSLGAAPPPPGITANFVDPSDHTRQILIQHIICLTLATVAVGIRLFTRIRITRNVGWDDYAAVFAWAMAASFSGILLAAIQYGFGRHIWDVPALWLIPQLKLGFVAEIMYLPIVLTIKLAFLLFFGRIFAVNNNKKVKWLVYGAVAANIAFYVAIFFATVFLCSPVARSYNPRIHGHCASGHVGPYISGVWAFMSDIYILILPIYCVWNLQAKRNRKLKLTFVFGVGLFACIASVIRFAYTVELINSPDVPWNFATLSFWSVFEIYIGLICACLPAFIPFFERLFPSGFSLSSYLSLFTSLLSRNRPSTENSKSIPVPANGKIMISSDYNVVIKDEHSQLEEGRGVAGYREIGDRTRLAGDQGHGREVDGTRGGPRFSDKYMGGEFADKGFPTRSMN